MNESRTADAAYEGPQSFSGAAVVRFSDSINVLFRDWNVKANIYAISSDTHQTVSKTAPFQPRKNLIDLVISW